MIRNISHVLSLAKESLDSVAELRNIKLEVEVNEVKDYKGMQFLKLKDSSGIISAIVYRSVSKGDLIPNLVIKIKGKLDIYNGQVQLNILSYKKTGQADIKFTEIKNKLTKLGYFDKKPELDPKLNYNSIGIISSLNAAGLKDFIHQINQRCENKTLYIYPSSVQGKDAANEIQSSIKLANTHAQAQIIVLIRGGGSKSDLECFNSEELAMSIFQSKIPIVTGIGHQIDVSIADLVSVQSFITPTAAALGITKEKSNPLDMITLINNKINSLIQNKYSYILSKQEKLSKYGKLIFSSLDTASYQSQSIRLKNIIINSLSQRHDYIINSECSIFHTINEEFSSIEKILSNNKSQLLLKTASLEQIIKSYEITYSALNQIKIIDSEGNEITSKLDFMKKNLSYKICFIDGIYNLCPTQKICN